MPLGPHRVVGSRQELVDQLNKIKIGVPIPAGIGEGAFSEIQRIISAEQNNCGNSNGKHRVKCDTQKRLQKVQSLAEWIVSSVFSMRKVVKEEIEEEEKFEVEANPHKNAICSIE